MVRAIFLIAVALDGAAAQVPTSPTKDCRGRTGGPLKLLLWPHALDTKTNTCRRLCAAGMDFFSGDKEAGVTDKAAWRNPQNIMADVVGSITKCDCGDGCSRQACKAGKNGKRCFTASQVNENIDTDPKSGLLTGKPLGVGRPRGCHYNGDQWYKSLANTCAYEAFRGTCRYSSFHGHCLPSPSPAPHMNNSAIEV
jgi:hypothetical protein